MRNTIRKMKEFRIIKLVVIIQYILDRCSLIDMLLYRNWGGVISQLFGYARILNTIRMWLSKFKKALRIIWKQLWMKFRFCKRLKNIVMTLIGMEKLVMILMLSDYSTLLCIEPTMVIIFAWYSKFSDATF